MESKGKKAMDASRPHLLTVAEYMTADIEGRTELIGGVVYDVSPRNEPHRDSRRVKIPLYVNAGVPAWIVNIPKRRLEFYGDVGDLAMEHGRAFGDGDEIDILGVVIPVAKLFPPRTSRLSWAVSRV